MAMSEPEGNPNSQLLPAEIMEEILIRCPVKSLLRFLSVSKRFESTITNPYFMSKKQNYAIKQAGPYLDRFTTLKGSGFDDAWEHDILKLVTEELRIESKTDHHKLKCTPHVIGSSKGLVCLSLPRFLASLFLWNPAIRKCVKIPSPMQIDLTRANCFDTFEYKPLAMEFFYDDIAEDYKLFLMEGTHVMRTTIEVFELKKNAWRVFDIENSPICGWREKNFVFFNGAMHFISMIDNGYGHIYRPGYGPNQVISIDLSRGSVEKMRLPEEIERRDVLLVTLGGRLCAQRRVIRRRNDVSGDLNIWVMEEYGVSESWTSKQKLCCVPKHVNLLGFCDEDQKSVFLGNYGVRSVRYDLQTDKFTYLVSTWGIYPWENVTYIPEDRVESLVLLNGLY